MEHEVITNLNDETEKCVINFSTAEYELISKKAREIKMDIASYMKFIALNSEVDLTVHINEIKSVYKSYYPENSVFRWVELKGDKGKCWTASNSQYVFWINRYYDGTYFYELSQWEWCENGGTRHSNKPNIHFNTLENAKGHAEFICKWYSWCPAYDEDERF